MLTEHQKYHRKWREDNKEKIKTYLQKYNKENKDELNAKKRKRIASYSEEKKLSLRRKKKEWRDKNKGYMNKYNKNRKEVDPSFKLRMLLRSRLNKAVRGIVKQGSAVKDLGCSIEEFKLHLEKQFTEGMSWENYGQWEIDHKKALANFDLTNSEQFKEACHYSNMQPLWKADNRAKRDL